MRKRVDTESVLLMLTMLALLVSPTHAEIPDLQWELPEVIDSPVSEVSLSTGTSVLHSDGFWFVVYTKSGDAFCRRRDDNGWLAAQQLSTSGGALWPHISKGGGYVHVVWEDWRTGHPEVWTRRWDGDTWSPEECLTCDADDSRIPVIAGSDATAYVAWQEFDGFFYHIRGRVFRSGSWSGEEFISNSSAHASIPSIASHPGSEQFSVVWVDSRHGETEIYLDFRDQNTNWSGDDRLTDMPGDCDFPSVHAEWCCGDVVSMRTYVVFENDQAGHAEIYGGCYEEEGFFEGPVQLSPTDPSSSVRPNIGGFSFWHDICQPLFTIQIDNLFVMWTEETSGPDANLLSRSEYCFDEPPDSTAITTTGLEHGAVGAIEGNPLAGIMVVWVEDQEGTSSLMARRGSQVGCFRPSFDAPPPVLLAPAGFTNELTLVDACAGGPAAEFTIALEFDAELEADLTWDEPFGTPPFEDISDENGRLFFEMHGGGCSQAGNVVARCNDWEPLWFWSGVKSPDVDGDCIVDASDREYVESQLGSSDFCADLDGSSVVDEIDVAIVDAHMNDICTIVGVGDVQTTHLPNLVIRPNPTSGFVSIRVTLIEAGEVSLRVMDVTGRRVRDLGTHEWPAGERQVGWDGRDDAGHAVAPGVYFLAAQLAGVSASHIVKVLK